MVIKSSRFKTKIKYDFSRVLKYKGYKGILKEDRYPYWYWEIEDTYNGQKLNYYPSWEDLLNLLQECLLHEKKVDLILGRKHESQKWFNFCKKILDLIKNNCLIQDKKELKKYFDNLFEKYFEY